MNKLPEDVIFNCIIPYTYSPQSKELLNDIRSFTNTLELISTIYYNEWIIHYQEQEPEDKNWLINDIFNYLRSYSVSALFLQNPNIVKLWYRLYSINTDFKSERILDKIPVECGIRRFWGIFTPDERNDFIKIYGSE
uniref:Uncharacterized protein n=1 Tax=viral metagenome TaxID=1070528 RepID=A0A6C0HTK8_9ZZZZ